MVPANHWLYTQRRNLDTVMRDPIKFVFLLLVLLSAALGVYFVSSFLDRNRRVAETTTPDATTASTKETAEKSKKATRKKRDSQVPVQGQVASNQESAARDVASPASTLSTAAAESVPRKPAFQSPAEVPVGTTRSELTSQFGPPDVTLLWSDRGILTVKYVYVRAMRMSTYLLQGEKVIFSSTDPVTTPARTSSLSSPVR